MPNYYRGILSRLPTVLLLGLIQSGMAHDQVFSFSELDPLAGCWIDASGNSLEIWLPPENNLMLGTAQTVKDGSIVFYERLRIEKSAAGEVQFIAEPSNQTAAVFTLSSAINGRLVFSNPDHDFPTEIIYQLAGDATLHASIAGLMDGQRREIDFSKTRIACDQLFKPTIE